LVEIEKIFKGIRTRNFYISDNRIWFIRLFLIFPLQEMKPTYSYVGFFYI